MRVYELIQQLQDCDRPDAIVAIRVERPLYPAVHELATEVYYDSTSNCEVVIVAEVQE